MRRSATILLLASSTLLAVPTPAAAATLALTQYVNPFYSTIAAAAAEVARGHDTLLITASSEEDPDWEQHLLLDLCSRRVDGLLVVPAGPASSASSRPATGASRSCSTRPASTRCASGCWARRRRWPG